jgi:hypothetical protein
MKNLKKFNEAFEIDTFSRVGDKLWVNLMSSGTPGIPYGDDAVIILENMNQKI